MNAKTMVFNGLAFDHLNSRKEGVQTPAHGYYRMNTNGVHLYKLDGALEAYIVNNPRQGRFVVTASIHDGAPRYMFSTCSLTEKWLQIENMGLAATEDAIKAIQYH